MMAVLLMGSLTDVRSIPGKVEGPITATLGYPAQSLLRGDQEIQENVLIRNTSSTREIPPTTPETDLQKPLPVDNLTATTQPTGTTQETPIQTTCSPVTTASPAEEESISYLFGIRTIIKWIKYSMENATEMEILIMLSLWIWGFTMINCFAILIICCVICKRLWYASHSCSVKCFKC